MGEGHSRYTLCVLFEFVTIHIFMYLCGIKNKYNY